MPKDLLFHLPLRYEDRTRVMPIANLQPGKMAFITGRIVSTEVLLRKRKNLLVKMSDLYGSVNLRFFHFNQKQQERFKVDSYIQCYGEIRYGPNNLEMVHPDYQISRNPSDFELETTLTPVYPSTEGVGQRILRKLVGLVMDDLAGNLEELLPHEVCREFNLMSLAEALVICHRPVPDTDIDALLQGIHPAQQRLALEELLSHRLALWDLRKQRQHEPAPAVSCPGASWLRLLEQLDYPLTNAQLRVVDELFEDLAKEFPALRLIQGDVGSGKTVVAAAPALCAIDAGYQVALMAPTELLAEQHRETFCNWLKPLSISTCLLTGKLSASHRKDVLERIKSGKASMIIGTHALFQSKVEFYNLGLLVIDEQHRFGVGQRLSLRAKGDSQNKVPHQIIMSATPIPRSIAMVMHADLDISSIDELPPDRKEVKTVALPCSRRNEIVNRLRALCKSGQQVYWVCPLIDESDKLQAQAATDIFSKLFSCLPDLRIELIHGRMKSRDKERIMECFNQGLIDLLVSTTVIEVGVDVPNASLIVIENAERLGLAQLHQLRGRVGRGTNQATCVLLYEPPLGEPARKRLGILRQTNDGFIIARKDREQRGHGELLGTRQTGQQQMKIANISRDSELIPVIDSIAKLIQHSHPEVSGPLIDRWITDGDRYLRV